MMKNGLSETNRLIKAYTEYYNKLCTLNAKMNLIWFLEELDMDLAKQVRAQVGATFPVNPKL